jgi:hypothetical protein
MNRWEGKLAGGDGRLPAMAARAAAALLEDAVLRRPPTAIGTAGVDLSVAAAASLMAATTAATLVDVFVIDFRRVTRWFALRDDAPTAIEWELVRRWVCRDGKPVDELVEREER